MAHCGCDWCSAIRVNGATSIYDYECARFVPVDETKFAEPRGYVLLEFKVDRDEECWPRPEPRAMSAVQRAMRELARRAIVALADRLDLGLETDVERSEGLDLRLAEDELLEEDKVDKETPEPRADSTENKLEYRSGTTSSIPRTLPFDSAIDLASYPASEWENDMENYTTNRDASKDDMED